MNFELRDASLFTEVREVAKQVQPSLKAYRSKPAEQPQSSLRAPSKWAQEVYSDIKPRSAIVAIVIFFGSFTCGTLAIWNMEKDQRVMGAYPFVDSVFGVICLGVAYILFSFVWGPLLMRNRKAFNVRTPMLVYNVIQVIFSAWMFYEACGIGWILEYSYACQPCDFSLNPRALRTVRVAWFFYMSKILDFMDTIFFVMNKKFVHVSLLHVVHHSCMVVTCFVGVRYLPGGHVSFFGFINTFVHTVMYGYYLLAAMGPKVRPFLWWKKYLTTLQLTQFVLIFLHSAQLLFRECPQIPIGFPIWTCIYASIFFVLFIDFWLKNYTNASEKKAKKVQ